MAHPHLAELERIERNAWEDLARAAPPPFAAAIGLETRQMGGALFFAAAKIPQFQFNWLAGAGLGGDDGACIGEAVARFGDVGQTKFIVQIAPGPNAAQMETLARVAGLQASPLSWAKFCRETQNAPDVATSLSIREVDVEDRNVFAESAIAGFGMPAPMALWLSQIVGRPHWHAYASFEGDTPAGAAALYVDGDFAWLGIGATRPEMRRKGGQSALLARRIADAAKYGARHVVTETGVPQEGQPAPSYRNILSCDFRVAYVRPNWTLPPR
jgi:GNAT superfamily N-acetyltransferase